MKIKKFLSMIIAGAIMVSSMSAAVFAVDYGEEYQNQPTKTYSQTFTDVKKSYWAFSYISEMVDRGVLSGYPNGYFYPDNTITRAEFAKVMCLAASISVSPVSATSYADVAASEWFAPYVEAGKYYLSGYVSDGSKYYMPNDNALREDIAVALVKLKGYDTSLYDESILKAMFTDYQSISSGARKYVSVAVEQGLISGYEDNTFRGQNTITRAEAATLLWRAYQYGSGNKVFEKEEFEEPVETPKPTETMPKPNTTEPKTDEPEQTKEPVEEPEPEEEYLYSLKTIASGISNVDSMIATNDGIAYLDNNKVMKVNKDSNKATCVLDAADIEYLGTRELTKSQLAGIQSNIYSIGYNQNDECLYAIIGQWRDYYVYNLNNREHSDELKLKDKVEGSGGNLTDDLSYSKLISSINKKNLQTFIFDNSNNILIGKSTISENVIIDDELSSWTNVCISNKKFHYYADGRETNVIEVLTKSGEWQELDFYAQGSKLFSANNKAFYLASENEIGTVDTNGDYTVLCGVDDIDNEDDKSVRIRNIKLNTSAVDNDGVIYYWDINYNCIRQLEHN